MVFSRFRRTFGMWGMIASCGLASLSASSAATASEPAVAEIVRIEAKGIWPYDISPDGKYLVYVESFYLPDNKGRAELVLLDLMTGKERRRLVLPKGTGEGMVFSPDSKLVALGRPGGVFIWDVRRWEEVSVLDVPEGKGYVVPLAFSPDAKSLAGVGGSREMAGRLGIWELATGRFRRLGGKQQEGERPIPGTGSNSPSPKSVVFADDGRPFLFAEYWLFEYWACDGPFVQQWDIARNMPLHLSRLPYWCPESMQCSWFGRGRPTPGGPTAKLRFRTTPSGRVVQLPRYQAPPLAAIPYPEGPIALVQVPAGEFLTCDPGPHSGAKELHRLGEFSGATARTCILSPDGGRLVAVGWDPKTARGKSPTSLLYVWDVSRLREQAKSHLPRPTEGQLNEIWTHLADTSEHPRSLRAMVVLASFPDDALPFLRKKLAPPPELKQITQLIKDLDSPAFPTREKASAELEQLGPVTLPFLRKAREETDSAEVRRRVEHLLEKFSSSSVGEELRFVRLIDVCEHINSASARELLQSVATGSLGHSYSEAAKAALHRIRDKK